MIQLAGRSTLEIEANPSEPATLGLGHFLA